MNTQIRNSWDIKTLKKIGLEALKLGAITAGLFLLNSSLDLNMGAYTPVVIPIIRWLIGTLEQFRKGQ